MKKLLFIMLLVCSTAAFAAPRIGHHGERVLNCHKPLFFGELPANETKVKTFQKFSFYASENTDIATLNVRVNNQKINITSKQQPSGRYLITGQTVTSINEGKAWIKAASESMDGCNGLEVWNIYIQ